MSNNEPGYYAIIPANVRYDSKLPANAKLLYGEITALCNKEGYCWATNDYFAELYCTTEKTISRWIKCLKEKGLIECKLKTFRYEDGTIKKVRYIIMDKNAVLVLDKIVLDHTDKNVLNHMDKNVQYNNTNSNNTISNILDTNVSKEQSSEILPTDEVVRSKRSLDIDQAFVIWEEVMGYPLAANKTDRRYINILLNKKDMDLEKLRNMVRLVAASQCDKYKRFSITNYTELYYKTNDLMAWAREKQAQQQSNQTMTEV